MHLALQQRHGGDIEAYALGIGRASAWRRANRHFFELENGKRQQPDVNLTGNRYRPPRSRREHLFNPDPLIIEIDNKRRNQRCKQHADDQDSQARQKFAHDNSITS